MLFLADRTPSISVVTSVRNLRAYFDLNLNMTRHINAICQSGFYHLHNIRRIRKFLSLDNTKASVQAVVVSRIYYCNSLLVGVQTTHLSELQRLRMLQFNASFV